MSGTALCPWTLQDAPRETSLYVGAELGCPTGSSKEMVDCLRHRPAVQIVKSIKKLMVNTVNQLNIDPTIKQSINQSAGVDGDLMNCNFFKFFWLPEVVRFRSG